MWRSNAISNMLQTWPLVHRGLTLQLWTSCCWAEGFLLETAAFWEAAMVCVAAAAACLAATCRGQWHRSVQDRSCKVICYTWSTHYVFKATDDLNLLALHCLPWVCTPGWSGKGRKAGKAHLLCFLWKTGLIFCKSYTGHHRCLWIHEHNSPGTSRHYFTASLPNLWPFNVSTLMFPTPCKWWSQSVNSSAWSKRHVNPTPSQGAIGSWWPMGKEESAFFSV